MSKYIDADELKSKIINTPSKALDEFAFWRNDMLTVAANRQNEIIDMIDKMPAADMEPVKHGRWINRHDRLVKCSLCGESVLTNWRGFFCQNCGAKMDGGSEE